MSDDDDDTRSLVWRPAGSRPWNREFRGRVRLTVHDDDASATMTVVGGLTQHRVGVRGWLKTLVHVSSL